MDFQWQDCLHIYKKHFMAICLRQSHLKTKEEEKLLQFQKVSNIQSITNRMFVINTMICNAKNFVQYVKAKTEPVVEMYW